VLIMMVHRECEYSIESLRNNIEYVGELASQRIKEYEIESYYNEVVFSAVSEVTEYGYSDDINIDNVINKLERVKQIKKLGFKAVQNKPAYE